MEPSPEVVRQVVAGCLGVRDPLVRAAAQAMLFVLEAADDAEPPPHLLSVLWVWDQS